MKTENSEICIRESYKDWAIAIMPNDIRIDNYDGSPSIHLKSGGISIPIIYDDFKVIKAIIKYHLMSYRHIEKDVLIKRLIGDFL